MGRGEIFRFMPYSSAPSVAVGVLGADRTEVPAHAVPTAAVDFGAHSAPSPSSTPEVHSSEALWYVSCLAFTAHQHTVTSVL